MLVLLLAQAQEVSPQDPATLAWPAIAGGVAAVATTATIVLGVLWRVWRHLRRNVLEPLASLIGDWRGRPAEDGRPAMPGFPERMRRLERHLGNGTDRPLRQLVQDNAAEVARTAEVAQHTQTAAAAAHALAQQAAVQLAEHYVRGHGS